MTDTSLHSGARPNSTRRATSAWLALLAATLLIAPHAAGIQVLVVAAPEPQYVPRSPAEPQASPASETPRYTLNGRRSLIIAGGEYADFPGRTGHGFAPRAWLCPDAALFLAPERESGFLARASIPSTTNTLVLGLLDRGPPA